MPSRTDANAVAGPSNSGPLYPPLPSAPTLSPTATVPAPTAPVVVRSVAGPSIVPTILHPDGIKEVPRFFELCQVDDLITLISSMLERLIAHNDRIPLTPTSLTRFHSRAPPSINVPDYLLRIARYTNVESAVLLSLLPYVDKVCARLPTFTVSSLTVHRFVIAGVSVGSKALSDSFCTNGRYSRVGGVSMAEMNLLEKEFCEAIDWRLTTTGQVLAHYYTSLVHSHPLYRLPPSPTSSTDDAVPTAMDLSPSPLSPDALSPSTSPLSTSPSLSSPALSRAQSPALIPARMSTVRRVSASNLPSPVGGFTQGPAERISPTPGAIKRLLGSPPRSPGERGHAKRTLSPLGPAGRSPRIGGMRGGVLAGAGGQEPG